VKKRLILLLGVLILLLSLSVPAAFAISRINNDFWANDYTIRTNQKIYFTAKTTFGWTLFYHPYSSNFVTEVNAYHFRRPFTYRLRGLRNSGWYYRSRGLYTSPCYRYYSGWLWIWPTTTKYIKFTARARAAARGSRRAHRHGQSTRLNWDISTGWPAWIFTRHN
jgi:hypothetical protein